MSLRKRSHSPRLQPFLTPLLLAENDSRLGQIVGRKLHRDLVPGNDADEMLAHFAGDMGQDITLAGEIDTKHRAR